MTDKTTRFDVIEGYQKVVEELQKPFNEDIMDMSLPAGTILSPNFQLIVATYSEEEGFSNPARVKGSQIYGAAPGSFRCKPLNVG